MSEKPNNEDKWEFIHRLDSLAIQKQKEEIERLQAEVERLTFDPLSYLDDQGEWMPRHTHLAAVERLKDEVERFKFTLEEERQITRQDWAGLRCEHDRVKRALEQAEAEVERLRKAGDAMEGSIILLSDLNDKHPAIQAWNAAKEGKPSV